MAYAVLAGTASTELQLIALRGYADEHFSKGWDLVLTTPDEDLIEVIKGAKTCWSAIVKVGVHVKLLQLARESTLTILE